MDAPRHRAQRIDFLNYNQDLIFFLFIVFVLLVVGILQVFGFVDIVFRLPTRIFEIRLLNLWWFRL
ncbi:hypothetical protein [Halorhabdus rudnickae]|uniref:hypothetical protein n=1 Tax=Halorhabdus rudnickae TaxID=1775544 RepID=UPI001082ABF1|nr:hypothetical protein [Halorhabdus rudnickae]